MYSPESISYLEGRIGFGTLEIAVAIDPSLQGGTSARELQSFHKLATLRNIYATVEESLTDEPLFEDHLFQMRKDAVSNVLTRIFNLNKDYIPSADYSDLLLDRPELFDNAIGYSLATASIEQMMSTNRKGIEERNAKLAYDKLRMELEGIKDAYGTIQMNGLKREQYYAIKQAVAIIFPSELTIKSHPW